MEGGQLVLHCGGKPVDRLALAEVEIPEQTKSYMPVSHLALVEKIDGIARDMLKKELVRESFGLARKGDQMFGVLTYANGMKKCQECGATGKVNVLSNLGEDREIYGEVVDRVDCSSCNGTGWEEPEMGVSIGIRNSYDKSMSIGVALGGRVFVCDNLCISGEIKIVRKHTPSVWEAIENMAIATLYRHAPAWEAMQGDMKAMQRQAITHHHGHELLGVMIGQGVLSPRQIPMAYKEWDKPSMPAFEPRNVWSLYNSCNQALKTSPVDQILERHRLLHTTLVDAN
jgi:hypothetical protein